MRRIFCYFGIFTAFILVVPTAVALRFLPCAEQQATKVAAQTAEAAPAAEETAESEEELGGEEEQGTQAAPGAPGEDAANDTDAAGAPAKETTEEAAEEAEEEVPWKTVTVRHGDEILEMDLEEYVFRVTRAEVPASFSPQALRACSVAVRSYTVYKLLHGSAAEHNGAMLCTESRHCMAFGTAQEMPGCPVRAACRDTRGQVMCCDGEVCQTFFFSMCGGYTADSAHVFAASRAYLVPVFSPESAGLKGFETTAEFTKQELAQALREKGYTVTDEEAPVVLVQDAQGYVLSFSFGELTLGGTAARLALGLRSSCFCVQQRGETVLFTVHGYGHGVGLSQWGAELYARQGWDYEKILCHYYRGASVQTLAALLRS